MPKLSEDNSQAVQILLFHETGKMITKGNIALYFNLLKEDCPIANRYSSESPLKAKRTENQIQ